VQTRIEESLAKTCAYFHPVSPQAQGNGERAETCLLFDACVPLVASVECGYGDVTFTALADSTRLVGEMAAIVAGRYVLESANTLVDRSRVRGRVNSRSGGGSSRVGSGQTESR
jgi:hypothetical protein